jgi:hypothetical protein
MATKTKNTKSKSKKTTLLVRGHGNVTPLTSAPPSENKRDLPLIPAGKFGRIFPDLPANNLSDADLIALAGTMIETNPNTQDTSIPAGYTYFGQFVDHDLTLDSRSLTSLVPNKQNRSPELDLDSLYGRGPNNLESRAMYEGPPTAARFKIGTTTALGPGFPALPNDLPRRPDKSAIIGDARNDENLVVAQTHLLFLKFHNKVLADLPTFSNLVDVALPNESAFGRARRIVTWHYQWIVWHDFVRRLIRPGVFRSIEQTGAWFYRLLSGERPFMPFEFSVAAYRLGHSMVREEYHYNRVFTSATLDQLFTFTGTGDMAGLPTLPSNWIINWNRFYEIGATRVVRARALDTKLVQRLFNLHPVPGIPSDDVPNPALASLATRNLLRGKQVGLPSGQAIANEMGALILQPNDIATGIASVNQATPLWFYILREAELYGGDNDSIGPLSVNEGSKRLGPVGSRIVGETFWQILHNDSNSYLRLRPAWRPFLPSAQVGSFTMADLVRYVNDINPLGGDPD